MQDKTTLSGSRELRMVLAEEAFVEKLSASPGGLALNTHISADTWMAEGQRVDARVDSISST